MYLLLEHSTECIMSLKQIAKLTDYPLYNQLLYITDSFILANHRCTLLFNT